MEQNWSKGCVYYHAKSNSIGIIESVDYAEPYPSAYNKQGILVFLDDIIPAPVELVKKEIKILDDVISQCNLEKHFYNEWLQYDEE